MVATTERLCSCAREQSRFGPSSAARVYPNQRAGGDIADHGRGLALIRSELSAALENESLRGDGARRRRTGPTQSDCHELVWFRFHLAPGWAGVRDNVRCEATTSSGSWCLRSLSSRYDSLGASALRNEPGLANGIRISWKYRSSDGSASRLRSIYVFAGEACSMWVIFCPELSENRLFASLHSKRCALKARR
jgi:hypothetical protein